MYTWYSALHSIVTKILLKMYKIYLFPTVILIDH